MSFPIHLRPWRAAARTVSALQSARRTAPFLARSNSWIFGAFKRSHEENKKPRAPVPSLSPRGGTNLDPRYPRPDWDAPIITYEELKPLTEQPSEDVYLIDVRETPEVVQGSIPSSVSIPLSELKNALRLRASDFAYKYGFEKPNVAQRMIFYCRSGKRSATACDLAMRMGYTQTERYDGSWVDWVKHEQKYIPSAARWSVPV